MDTIKVKHTSIIIPNYNLGDKLFLEKSLSVYNEICHRYEPKGFYYDENKKELLIPRGYDLNKLENIFNMSLDIDYNYDLYDPSSFRLLKEPRDDIQKKAISYLLGEGDFSYSKKYSQLALTLDTGDGKTYCVIATLSFIKMKSMIITHNDNIKNQWLESLKKFTDLDERYICNIDSSKIIQKIIKAKTLPYKVYLINHRLIQSYGEKHGWDAITELFIKLKIGLKVYDEAHLEFEDIIKLDLHTNTKKTFYLTANFERSNYKENNLFKLCFKNVAKYGIETKDDKRKHIVYMGVLFNTKPNLDIQASIINVHGFDKNRYIDYEINQEGFFKAVDYIIDYFKNKNLEGKKLVLTSKIESSNILYNYLKEKHNDLSVGIINSQIKEDDRIKYLSSDIISSTPKSLGTGSDINSLRVIVMTEPYSSKITANQTSGRLREYGKNEYTFYVELVDIGFKKVYKMYKNRLSHFKNKCVKMFEIKI